MKRFHQKPSQNPLSASAPWEAADPSNSPADSARRRNPAQSATPQSATPQSASALPASARAATWAKTAGEGEAFTGELVKLAQAGQRPALNRLFGLYRSRVVAMARRRMGSRLGAKEDPEDLAQTTFREAARDFPRYEYRGKRSFLGWLNKILQNKIHDRAEYHLAAKRDSSREVGFLSGPGRFVDEDRTFDPVAPGSTGLESAELHEELEFLHHQLERLSPLHREAIRLVFFEGLSLRQAGWQLGHRSEDAVRMLIRRAEDRLKEFLQQPFGAE